MLTGKIQSRRLDRRADYLQGKLLVAMPNMGDSRFERSVIFMCSHSDKGAMGLVLNRPASHITFPELLSQLKIPAPAPAEEITIRMGGPVETGRGFVLHSADYFTEDSTVRVTPSLGLTATIDVLKALASGAGPRHAVLALGYAGWAPGQLETEMLGNGWLYCDADEHLVFGGDLEIKWLTAISKIGVDPARLSPFVGHA